MNKEQQRFLAAISAMTGLISDADWRLHGWKEWKALADASIDMADALLAELDRTKPEPEPLQPEGFPDFQKWIAYEGLGTIKEGDTDIFAHRNLSSLTERHNRAIAAFREWACRQAKAPQPDPDGWIPHNPGDPMPCDEGTMCRRRYRNGKIGRLDWAGNYSWAEWGGGETEIIAWKPD